MTENSKGLGAVISRVEEFKTAAHVILSTHESSAKSRVISLERSRRELQSLSISQEDLFRESLDCIEYGLYRAAHVAAWQAFVDFMTDRLTSDGLQEIKEFRPKWSSISNAQELRETRTETEIIEVARAMGMLTKAELRILNGHLAKRNECAHPSSYKPNLNESLGYVSELLNRISLLRQNEK